MEGVFVSIKPCALHECNLKAGWAATVDVAITTLLIQKKVNFTNMETLSSSGILQVEADS